MTTPPTNEPSPPGRGAQVVGALVAVAFIALLGLRTAKVFKDREQVRMYQQHQADYFEHGLADDVMEMHREQQMAELQPMLNLIATVRADNADTDAGADADTPLDPKHVDALKAMDDDRGPTPVEPDPSAPDKEH